MNENNKGITLIALVITIIVLLILAAVSIMFLTGNNGILDKATSAKEENLKASATENLNLKLQNLILNKNGLAKLTDLNEFSDSTSSNYDSEITIINKVKSYDTQASIQMDGYTFTIDKSLKITTVMAGTSLPAKRSLYYYGDECNDLTGGWLMSAQAYSGGEKGSNYFKIWFFSSIYNVASFTTANKVDLLKYTKLHVVANYTGSHCSTYTGRFEATDSTNKTLTTYFTYSNGQNQDYSLDLSSITGSVNISIWGCAEIYIYEVYLSNT